MSTTPNPTPAPVPTPTTYTPTIATPSIASAPVAPVVVSAPIPPVAPTPAALPTSTPVVALYNKSTVVADSEIAAVAAALQVQVDRDFGPLWKCAAEIVAVPSIGTPPPHAWVMEIADDAPANMPGVLGFHDTAADDTPEGFDFAGTDKKYGQSYTLTASHELVELLADQWAISCCFVQTSDTAGLLYPIETADPVEGADAGYLIDNVLVSDFVTPAWFDNQLAPGSAKFDFCGHLTKPLEVMQGGYVSVFQVLTGSGWTQRNSMEVIGKAPDYNDDPRHRR